MVDDSAYPKWDSESEINAEWIRTKLKLECSSCRLNPDQPAIGGMSGSKLTRLVVETIGAELPTLLLVMKECQSQASKQYGLQRECQFYDNPMAGQVGYRIPKVFYSHFDNDGKKVLFMEDLTDTVQCGYFFGPGNPNNWGKDLESLTKGFTGVDGEKILSTTFREAAKMHKRFWGDKDILKHDWLRNSANFRKEEREKWQAL